ncbi:uncharacterized protein KGF55_002790 [Candida pseudojiufengensis]|uniref:uncharacterized protein n=1 Tax=Candida pseudojiufengensis TaxID=497109 RepID=UPI0022254114|nr:uncharacterized protein KGF55_002790 [Candida pseudojiufengensis]KAI5962998.1 hypothetical protein KGF55_002790 [Candida pseudojiufengensis]
MNHLHHHHHDIATPTTIIASFTKRDDASSDMPSLPKLSSAPSLSITAIPKNQFNPYTNVPNLPSNLVFIIVGCILASILIGVVLYRIITHYIYSSKAQYEKEIYYSNNVTDLSTNYSFPIRSRATSFVDSSSTSSQGKSLQNHLLSDKQQFRKSMFINPSLEYKSIILQQNNSSSLYLQTNNSSIGSLMKPLGPYLDSNTITSIGGDSEINGNSSINNGSVQTTLRPPSLYLEELLNSSEAFNRNEV